MKQIAILLLILLRVLQVSGKVDSLLQAAGKMSNTDTSLPVVYSQIASAYFAANDTANALAYLQKSRLVSEQLRSDKGIMSSTSNIGMYYTRFGKIDSAITYFTLCLNKARQINDVTIASKTCSNLAGAYLSRGSYAEAVQYYIEAIKYLEQTNDQPHIASNYHCLGIAYYMLKNYPLSLKYYNKSIETGLKIGTPDKTGYNYNGIGVVYKELKQYDSAIYYLDKAHADAERNNDVYLLSHNLSNTGEVYSLQGHFKEALACLSKAQVIQVQNSDQRGVGETDILLGDAYAGNKDYTKAGKYYDSARTIAVNIDAKDVLKNAWKGLAEVYKGMNNYPAALEAYRHYTELKDTLYTEESTRQIAEMQTKYNTEKKEKENIILQKENAVNLLQITKEKNQKYILIGSLFFIIITSVIYYNQYRLKQKSELLKERELRAYAVFQAQEDEKGRLSQELHDGVGALLSLIKLNISSIQPDGSNENILSRTKNLASDAIKEVRGISHDLMPSVLAKSGLQAALAELTESINASGSLEIELAYNLVEHLSPAIEGNIFRIIQEATNNIIKHAAATHETLTLSLKGDRLLVSIADNGKGFDKSILSKITGNGLNNIYSRINVLKGEVNIETGKGTGTRIEINVPIKNSGNV